MKTLLWLLRGKALALAGLTCLVAAGLALPLYADELPAYPLTVENGHFTPETVTVPAGQRFKIVVTNKGPGPEEFESIELKKETVLAPGVTRAVVFAPLKPGTYKFFGDFHPETAKGQIVVK
ncbi:MAG: cupredoxin domain-containing protein [Sulfuricella sp.]|nr:cupredoxin domain-containing protein [Sulfuricella sp.]